MSLTPIGPQPQDKIEIASSQTKGVAPTIATVSSLSKPLGDVKPLGPNDRLTQVTPQTVQSNINNLKKEYIGLKSALPGFLEIFGLIDQFVTKLTAFIFGDNKPVLDALTNIKSTKSDVFGLKGDYVEQIGLVKEKIKDLNVKIANLEGEQSPETRPLSDAKLLKQYQEELDSYEDILVVSGESIEEFQSYVDSLSFYRKKMEKADELIGKVKTLKDQSESQMKPIKELRKKITESQGEISKLENEIATYKDKHNIGASEEFQNMQRQFAELAKERKALEDEKLQLSNLRGQEFDKVTKHHFKPSGEVETYTELDPSKTMNAKEKIEGFKKKVEEFNKKKAALSELLDSQFNQSIEKMQKNLDAKKGKLTETQNALSKAENLQKQMIPALKDVRRELFNFQKSEGFKHTATMSDATERFKQTNNAITQAIGGTIKNEVNGELVESVVEGDIHALLREISGEDKIDFAADMVQLALEHAATLNSANQPIAQKKSEGKNALLQTNIDAMRHKYEAQKLAKQLDAESQAFQKGLDELLELSSPSLGQYLAPLGSDADGDYDHITTGETIKQNLNDLKAMDAKVRDLLSKNINPPDKRNVIAQLREMEANLKSLALEVNNNVRAKGFEGLISSLGKSLLQLRKKIENSK